MKISFASLSTILISQATYAGAFVVPSPFFVKNTATSLHMSNGEFDHFLGEGTQVQNAISTSNTNSNNIISLPDSSAAATATLTSSVSFEQVADDTTATDPSDDIYSDDLADADALSQEQLTSDPRIAEIIRKEQQQVAMKSQPTTTTKTPISLSILNFLKGKDFGEIFFTVLVPVIGGYYFTKKAYVNASARVGEKAEDTLDDYANEMIYHDGDFEEMKLAHSDYSKKLVFMGPKKSDVMIKRYLEFYAKKKTVSPQSISSLSYVFSIYGLTEERAAEILCELCASMPEKVASAGKLLFFGEHILKSPEAKAKLEPLKKLLASVYDDEGTDGETIVTKSQVAMGEAAYRASVASAGKGQTELTIGWEVLGVDEGTAIKIFEEVSGEGFLTQTQAKYAAKQQKFDRNGSKMDEDGKLENPEDATEDDDDNVTKASGNVQECTECGYTLFVAEGRDFKFFNAGFTCPECGAGKDKFKAADI